MSHPLMHATHLVHLDEEQTAELVDEQLALDAARAAFTATTQTAPLESLVVRGSDPRNRFTVKPAVSTAAAGMKIGTYWPGNDQLGLPRHHSTLILLDQRTGRVHAVLDMGTANAYRTAAADALAVELLSGPDAGTLAVFGTGHQARFDALAVSRVRPIQHILVVGRDPRRAAALAESLSSAGHDARPSGAREACAAADVIVTATTATTDSAPLFDADHVRPGTHVSCMGADGPGKRELPPELLGPARLFCDLPDQARRLGEFQHAPGDAPLTTLGEVLTGREPGRTDTSQITVFDSSGIGLQDLYLGLALLERKGIAL